MNKKYLLGCLSILAATATLGSCTDDNNEGNTTTGYVWTTDGGLKACNQLLFDEQGKDDAKGTVIGNGDQEFVFTGKQTLKKGTYTLKGWVYIASGAELTIEPGTVIKGGSHR